jgi:hypothetical protein
MVISHETFRLNWAMRLGYIVLIFTGTLFLGHERLHAQDRPGAHHVTVPMSVEGNAPIITLSFRRPDGSIRSARFLFDSGGGAIILAEGLAKDIALQPKGAVFSNEGVQYQEVDLPTVLLGEMSLDLQTSKAFVHLGASSFIHNRVNVDGMLPGKALEHSQIVLDYPQHRLSVGEAGSLPHRGEKLPCPYVASSGHPQVEVEIDGIEYGFLLDTGTQITLMREDMLKRWAKQHTDWPRSIGAAGPANEGADPDNDFLLRIPRLQFGSFALNHVAVAARSNETYSATMYETPAAIVGALGGNVLSQFRVEIDYPEQLCFFEHSGKEQANDFDTVGLVLDTNEGGQLVVRAVSSTASAVTRQNIQPGDIILQISGSGDGPYTLTKAVQALSGVVGERKHLRILRRGEPMSATVVVSRIL